MALWFSFSLLLSDQGFGMDTDSWLMARTAALLRAGEGYDPARSFGNPLWEFLLAVLQPDFEFRISNAWNILLALFFLFRLPAFLSASPQTRIRPGVFLLVLLPVFTEAASSSMELMTAWLLLLEGLLAIKKEQVQRFFFLSLACGFVRPELYFVLAYSAAGSKKIPKFILGICGTILLGYLFWAWGKNPLPVSSPGELLQFYAGRIWFLVRQAGLLLPLYLYLIFVGIHSEELFLKRCARAGLLFMLLFPFEWYYVFPAMLSGWLVLIRKAGFPLMVFPVFVLSLTTTLIFPYSGLPALYRERKLMFAQFQLAENYLPGEPVLLLDGATFLTCRFADWERSHRNRLFHRKNTNFWVGERFSGIELDSFQRAGFRLLKFSGTSGKKDWLASLPGNNELHPAIKAADPH